MRPPLRFRRLGCRVVLLFLFAASRGLSQDYETDFKRGLRARDQGSWQEAITYFKRAAEARPQEGTERISSAGVIGYPYLPHYYLGEAYANSGNCAAALEELEKSEKQGFVQRAGKYKDLQKLREDCAGKVARVASPRPIEPALTPTAVAVMAAPSTAVGVVVPPTQAPQPRPTENALAQQSFRDAQTEVRRAAAVATVEARLREGSIKSGAWQKDPSLQKKNKTATDDLAAASTALEEGRARGDVSKLRAARDVAVRANQEFSDLQRLLLDSQKIASQVTPAPPLLPRDVNISQTAAAVPPALLEGASAYFARDYARAARTLAAAPDFPDRRAAAEARLFRSAARYALYVIGGAKDGNLQRSALQDASDCRRLDPQVSPNRKVFSPRFVQFFTQVTASRADH